MKNKFVDTLKTKANSSAERAQAGFLAPTKAEYFWQNIRHNRELQDKVDEKFAELIVQECAKLVEDNIDPYNAWITPAHIKQHFGVEG
jgi:hypothetical protein